MSLWVNNTEPIELRGNFSADDAAAVIRAAYRQVLGNAHLLEGDRLTSAESALSNGDITVRQFINAIGLSDLYRRRFFESSSQYRFIELNFKHFLGRAPQSQAEISEHVQRYNAEGYDAEINSYLDSSEYLQNFGDNGVPYARGTQTQVGQTNVTFNRSFALMRGDATSDASTRARLIGDLAGNRPSKIVTPARASGAAGTTGKRFRIVVAQPGSGSRYRQANCTYEVGYPQLSNQIQSIQRRGGRILSITEA